ncbi:L-aspartate oxidase [Anaerovorax odorimutans]|uniref:L-aspartate oxidase n=1 Tax=Anaerovorax odorimutans TaxID=109327 RepID=UPI0004180AED|nr:L-aspartate oxidase [Anaerovorax odorimutans]
MDKTDVIIVGTGAAGLFCALNLPENLTVRMITKDEIENSDSYLAQGGIAALRNSDDYDNYFEDTLKAGHYKNNKVSVEVMIKSSPEIINELIEYGVDFDHTQDGLSYTREGGHSQYRILHHKDITGKEITSTLLERVREKENVKISEYTKMVDIIEEDNICKGIIVKNQHKELEALYAKIVVFATGGIGGLFKHSTNFKHISGDSLAISIIHNIKLQDINYIQIHPTSLYSKEMGRRFLISEAVRGEGAVLLNDKGERFVDELQPRDIVASAIKEEMKKDNTEFVNLSMKHLDMQTIKKRFPNIYKHCLEVGYDLTKESIPVTPAQHYFMGGIKVDLDSKTSMENLFAVGETSCNGVHGQNRLGSNSLLESLVFSKRAAKYISNNIKSIDYPQVKIDLSKYDYDNLKSKYKQLILNEIKRKDKKFYEQWCNNDN